MAVTIVKPKAKQVAKEDLAQVVTPELVDEYASKKSKLDKKTAKIAPLKKEVDKLEKGILGAVDEVIHPSNPIDLSGIESELKIGKQGLRTELSDAEAVFDILGAEVFFKLAKISTTDLKAYLTPDQLKEVTISKYAIKRRIKIEDI